LFKTWGQRDPIGLYEEYLKEEGISAKVLGTVEVEIAEHVEGAAAEALASREKMPAGETALGGVYASRN
jgi:TPP-dependent pyruvate/acetoin dehydrogenase alpha subunit